MLPFNALNERNRKQEIGNEASGFYPLSPGQTKETTRRKTMLTSRPKRKACLHWLPGSVERHSLTAFNLQSKKATRQNQKASPYTDFQANRRTGPHWCQPLIEGHDLTGASPNRRRPTECKSKGAPAWVEELIFLSFILFLPLHFLAFQYGCNSVGYLFPAFLLLCTNASN